MALGAVLSKIRPIVYYTDAAAEPVVGQRAKVFATNHPVLGKCWVTTSAVVNTNIVNGKTSGFITRNTLYAPTPVDESNPYRKNFYARSK